MKGTCPRPLDEGDALRSKQLFILAALKKQAFFKRPTPKIQPQESLLQRIETKSFFRSEAGGQGAEGTGIGVTGCFDIARQGNGYLEIAADVLVDGEAQTRT